MPSPELQLLFLSVRAGDPGASADEARRLIEDTAPDWETLLRLARLHAVMPQLAMLAEAAGRDLLPEKVREEIVAAHSENLYRQLAFASEFLRLKDMFGRTGIKVVPFKGFILGHEAYANMADREGGDIDVFVSTRYLKMVKELMEADGYSVEPAFRGLTVKGVMKISQEYVFEKVIDGISSFRVEFHWGISPPAYGMGVRLEDLRSQLVRGKFQGDEMTLFTPSAHMLLVILHHGGDDRFANLKQVHDIAMMVRQYRDVDWDWVTVMAERFHAEDLVFTAVLLASMITGVEVPVPL